MRRFLFALLILCAGPGAPGVFAQAPAKTPPAETAPASIFIQETEPRVEILGGMYYDYPPGPDMQVPRPETMKPERWRMKDGRTLNLKFTTWRWEREETAGAKTRWKVMTTFSEGEGEKILRCPAADFSPAETQRLLRLMWGGHLDMLQSRRVRHARVAAETSEAAAWVQRIEKYTGMEPRQPGEKALPPLDSPGMKQAPDLRTFKTWTLNSLQGRPRDVGTVQILDWAVVDTPDGFFGPTGGIPIKVRFGDGTEEVVPLGCLRLNHRMDAVLLSLWKDWASLRAAGGDIPGAALKVKALTASLPTYWPNSDNERQQELTKAAWAKAAKPAEDGELRKPMRVGRALTFPGLPPAGHKVMDGTPPARTDIPVLDQGPLGNRASDCLPSSIATFFLWWDEKKWLPLQQKGDLNKRADWLHSQLAREMRTQNNRGTQWSSVLKGLTDFSKRFLKSGYAFQLSYDYDYTPANLARYMTGAHATVLSLTTWKGARKSGSHAVAVLDVTAEGEMTIATWGLKITGTWKVVDLPKAKRKAKAGAPAPLPTYELDLSQVPEDTRKKLNGMRFILDSENYDGLAVITPYVRDATVPLPKPVP